MKRNKERKTKIRTNEVNTEIKKGPWKEKEKKWTKEKKQIVEKKKQLAKKKRIKKDRLKEK